MSSKQRGFRAGVSQEERKLRGQEETTRERGEARRDEQEEKGEC